MGNQNDKKSGLKKFRIILIAPYVITTFILIPLILIKKSTLIQIELIVQTFTFNLLKSETGQPFASNYLNEAQFIHFDNFQINFEEVNILTGTENNKFKYLKRTDFDSSGILKIIPEDNYSSIFFYNIQLSELNLKKNARVSCTLINNYDGILNIVIDGSPTEGKIIIGKSQYIETQYCRIMPLHYEIENNLKKIYIYNKHPQEINFHSRKNNLTMSIQPADEQNFTESNIYIENISFLKGSNNYLQTSLLKPGKIIFKDFNDKEMNIDSHDFVVIGQSENLQVTQMVVSKEGIKLVVNGKVGELKAGPKHFLSNRLPSLLEWIYHRKPIILFLNTVILISSTILTVMHRLKLTH